MKEELASPNSPFVSPELVWVGAIFHRTGYGIAARNHLRGLGKIGFPVQIREIWKDAKFLPSFGDMSWIASGTNRRLSPNPVCVLMHPPGVMSTGETFLDHLRYSNPGMGRYVAYTMFESDRIPASWVQRLEEMDEVWVPTAFNRETFVQSGLDEKKVRVVPLSIDTDFFDARRHFPTREPDATEFRFLSVFEWIPRKGWDVLLRAFFQEFRKDENVSLTLRTFRGHGGNPGMVRSIREDIEAFTKSEFGARLCDLPRVHIDESRLSDDKLPSYYLGYDAYVSASRGEGWGMPMMEAMSLGIPTAAPRWGGQLEFMNEENSYLVDIDGVVPVGSDMVLDNPIYAGHRWAEPSVSSLRRAMRRMFCDPDLNLKKARIAREEIVREYSLESVARKVSKRVLEIAAEAPSPPVAPEATTSRPAIPTTSNKPEIRVAIRSGSSQSFGHQRVDYEFSKLFDANSGVVLVEENESPEFLISHDDPPSLEPPPPGCRWIWFARWPFEGGVPESWVPVLQTRVDEIWVTCESLREPYLQCGISESKIRTLPLGVDTRLFRPEASPIALPDNSSFRFLAVLSADDRQSFETLCGAFMNSFRQADDVSLVIKWLPLKLDEKFRQRQSLLDRARQLPAFGKVLTIDRELDEEEMAGLYTSCHALILPYEQSFHRTAALEAMASGIPVIASMEKGERATIREDRAFPIPTKAESATTREATFPGPAQNRVPFEGTLADILKQLWTHRELGKERAARALRFVREERSWQATAEFVRARTMALRRGESRQERRLPLLPAIFLAQEDVALPESGLAMRREPLSASVQGGGFAGSIGRASRRYPDKFLLLATGAFESSSDIAAQLIDRLEQNPESVAAMVRKRAGAVVMWRSPRREYRYPVYESFRSGAYLLDLVRDASSKGLAIHLEMCRGIGFRADDVYEEESRAVEALVLGQELRHGGRAQDAMEQVERSLRDKPDYAAALAEGVEMLLEADRIAEAERWAHKLMQTAPGWSRSRHLFGLTCVAAGKEREGGLWVYQAFQMDAGNYLIVFDLAQLYDRCGNRDQAFQCYRRALAQNPQCSESLSRCLEIIAEDPSVSGAAEFLAEWKTFERPTSQLVATS